MNWTYRSPALNFYHYPIHTMTTQSLIHLLANTISILFIIATISFLTTWLAEYSKIHCNVCDVEATQ